MAYQAIPPASSGGMNAWDGARRGVLSTLVSGLTFEYVKSSLIYQATSGAAPTIGGRDQAIVGGGMAAAATNYLTCTGVILTDLTTQPHAWACRGKFAAITANFQSMGPIGTGGDQYANLTALSTYDATHLVMELFKAGPGSTKVVTTHVIDGLNHNYGMTFDGTTYSALVDDVVVGTTATLTNLTSGSRVWASYNGTASETKVYELVYGYRLP